MKSRFDKLVVLDVLVDLKLLRIFAANHVAGGGVSLVVWLVQLLLGW